VGRPLLDLFADKNLKLMFADILDADGYYETVSEIDINSEPRYFKIVSDKLMGQVSGLFIDIADITKTIESEMRAKEAAVQSNAANESKSKFLATMSHEIRTPMNAILGITDIELNRDGQTPEVRSSFERIYASGHNLLNIINDILDLSKIETGKLELVPVSYDAASLINDTVQLNIIRVASKPVKFQLEVDDNLPARLFGDELRVKQILNNLLTNAIKYTDKGNVRLFVSCRKPRDGGDNEIILVMKVSDTGLGMSKEQMDSIFDEYTRFNMEANRNKEGTGLGMSIVRSLVRMMDGEILVDSELSVGTTFTVFIKQGIVGGGLLGREVAENLMSLNYKAADGDEPRFIIRREPMPYGKVLVVDDMEMNIFVTKGLLLPYKLKVETASSGFEAIDKVKSGAAYDIIFMDHMMPQMDGLVATKIIRELGYSKPVVALTANAVAGQQDVFMKNGFDGFISKPIDIRRLDAVLNKFIRNAYMLHGTSNPSYADDGGAEEEDEQIKKLVLAAFVRDAKRAVPALEINIDEADDDAVVCYIVNVHAMKSALLNLGLSALSETAKELEAAGKRREFGTIKEKTPPLVAEIKKIAAKIEEETEAEAAGGNVTNEPADGDFLAERLNAISRACGVYDARSANAALKSLNKNKWPQNIREGLAGIERMMLHSDFEAAAKAAKEMIAN
jgi:signal transduction histidine kinase/DNA-binding response OmpR family regulator